MESDREAVAELQQRLHEDERAYGRLFASIAFKRALVKLLGREGALAPATAGLCVPDAQLIRRRTVVPMLEFARRSPQFRELWRGGAPFVVAPPRVIGVGDQHAQRGVRRSGWVARIDDVVVRGRSAVLLASDGSALVDVEGDEDRQFEDNPEFDPAVLAVDGRHFWTIEAGDDVAVLEEAFMLGGTYAHDFGHWITEHLARLTIALRAGMPKVPLLIDQRMPATHLQALRLFVPDFEVIQLPHLAARRVRRLWVAPNPLYRGFSPTCWSDAWHAMMPEPADFAGAIADLKQRAAYALAEPTGVDRLFLARRPHRKKRLVNHAAIEKIAAARGYRIVYPEEFDFATQIRLVHNARRIVAPDGSAGLLSYFARPGTSVCFLNNPHTLPLVELGGIFACLGVEYSVLTGPIHGVPQPEPFWNDYEIDPAVFESYLSAIDGEQDEAVVTAC